MADKFTTEKGSSRSLNRMALRSPIRITCDSNCLLSPFFSVLSVVKNSQNSVLSVVKKLLAMTSKLPTAYCKLITAH
jgi:hypothetical protein